VRRSTNALIHVGLSAVAVILVLLLAFAEYSRQPVADENGRLLVSGAFLASCAFGISLAVRPNWYRRIAAGRDHREKESPEEGGRRTLLGHHPDCEFFGGHRMALGGRAVCAGCFGIAIGALLAVIMTICYVALVRKGIGDVAQKMVLIGSMTILLAFMETALPRRSSVAHVVSNALIIIGLFLTAFGLLEATGNQIVGFLGILFGYLWMDTRVRLSAWRHSLVCNRCGRSCKMY